jgi:hypothetical protein
MIIIQKICYSTGIQCVNGNREHSILLRNLIVFNFISNCHTDKSLL